MKTVSETITDAANGSQLIICGLDGDLDVTKDQMITAANLIIKRLHELTYLSPEVLGMDIIQK